MPVSSRQLCFVVLTASCAAAPGRSDDAPAPLRSGNMTTGAVPSPVAAKTRRPADASSASSWAEVTRSPWPTAPTAPTAGQHLGEGVCGSPDAALDRVAESAAEAHLSTGVAPDADAVAALMRQHGSPHLRPRVLFAASKRHIDESAVRPRLAALGAAMLANPLCGSARARAEDGAEVIVVVTVEALADLSPLPVRARTGEWLSFEAKLNVAARGAHLVVLGPRGTPRTVPTTLGEGGVVRARFAPDRPGDFTVQLVADLDEGPRPVLEARLFADVAPQASSAEVAPGEDSAASDDDGLARMIATLRREEGLAPLRRDAQLDALARAHAERMRKSGLVAHDVGEGDLSARIEAVGGGVRVVGENVARASSLALAHRALYASPSHRMNLLRSDFASVGLGVVPDGDGRVFVCEIFAR